MPKNSAQVENGGGEASDRSCLGRNEEVCEGRNEEVCEGRSV